VTEGPPRCVSELYSGTGQIEGERLRELSDGIASELRLGGDMSRTPDVLVHCRQQPSGPVWHVQQAVPDAMTAQHGAQHVVNGRLLFIGDVEYARRMVA